MIALCLLLTLCSCSSLRPILVDQPTKTEVNLKGEDRFLLHRFSQVMRARRPLRNAPKTITLGLEDRGLTFNDHLDVTAWNMRLKAVVDWDDGKKETFVAAYSYRDQAEVDNIFMRQKALDYLIEDLVEQLHR